MQYQAEGANEIFGNGTSYKFDLHSWVEENYLASYAATVSTVPGNSMEEWLRNHRLLALEKGLETDALHQHSSSCSISSCFADANKVSQVAVCNSLDARISSGPSGYFLSPKSIPLQTASPRKFESENLERLPIRQQEEKETRQSTETHPEVKSSFKNKELYRSNCMSTNRHRKSNTIKESLPNKSNANLQNNCCEPIIDNKENIAKLPSYNSSYLMTFKSSTGFIDSHCHIDLLLEKEKFKGSYAEYMKRHKDSYPVSYNGCIAVFHRPATFEKKQLCWRYLEQDNVWGAFGCHPKQAKSYNATVERYLELALDHPKVRALGEIGLDYSEKNWQYKGKQQYVFRKQLEIAQRRSLRVVIHCREADDDAISILKQVLPQDAIFHLHCFTGTWTKALKWLKEFPNVYIGITNYVTFPNATATHEVARRLPLNHLLLETDAPYFKPSNSRKLTRHAHPGMAIYVAAQIAALKDIPLDAVLQATCANTRRMYNLP